MKNQCLILYLIITFSSCTSTEEARNVIEKEKHILQIDPEKAVDYLLSDLFKNYELITLPISEFGLIHEMKKVVEFGQYLAIADRNRIIFMNEDHHLVNSFSKQGKGPGEYIELTDINTSKDGKQFFVLDEYDGKLLEYTVEAELINQFRDNKMKASKSFTQLDDGKYVFYGGAFFAGGLDHRLLILNESDKSSSVWGKLNQSEGRYNFLLETSNFYYDQEGVFFIIPSTIQYIKFKTPSYTLHFI